VSDVHHHHSLLIAHHYHLKSVLQARFKNDYAGFQQYALGVAATVAKVNHVHSFLSNCSYCYVCLDSFQHFLR